MKGLVCLIAGLILTLVCASVSLAAPSSTFWTPCSIDIQPAGTVSIGVSNFLAFGSSNFRDVGATDIGLQFGTKINSKLAAEYGLDIISSPFITPFFLNVKIGYRENTLSDNAPALQIGFWGGGTKKDNKDFRQNIVFLTAGKTLSDGRTRLMVSYYVGNARSLLSSVGEIECNGYMLAIDHRIGSGKWVLAGDYASGQNLIGGGGFGVYYHFCANTNALLGPVWFNDKGLNGSTKILLQINISI
ncbi:MAG: hypothetical protein NT018_04520 [Armatimonadetes bacterium]|nr:hypothetical protein [Armatimonadota bacterium]